MVESSKMHWWWGQTPVKRQSNASQSQWCVKPNHRRIEAKSSYTLLTVHDLWPVQTAKRRAAEYEADAIGIHLLAKACYDPDANITMLQKLEAAQQKAGAEVPPELLSTHPLTQVNRVCCR